MAQIKRETASICLVRDLLDGEFVKTEGWNPSYIKTRIGNISRASLMGVLVSKDPDGLVFDDGSGRMLLRSFDEASFSNVEVGDFLLVVGRPRVYNEQKYVLPEIMKKLPPAWGEFRKREIELISANARELPKENRVAVSEPVAPTANYFQKLLDFIKDLDTGEGAPSEEVMKRSGVPNAESLMRKLIEEGEIFELRPGRVKILG